MTWLALWYEALALMNAPMDLPRPPVIFGPENHTVCAEADVDPKRCMNWEIHVRADECFATSFLHEASHYLAIKTGRLAGVPNERVKARLEEIAHDVERRSSTYQPNCIGLRP